MNTQSDRQWQRLLVVILSAAPNASKDDLEVAYGLYLNGASIKEITTTMDSLESKRVEY